MRRSPRIFFLLVCAALCARPLAAQNSEDAKGDGAPADAEAAQGANPAMARGPQPQDGDSSDKDSAPPQGEEKGKTSDEGGVEPSSIKITVEPSAPAAADGTEAPDAAPAPAPKPPAPKAKRKTTPKKKKAVVSTPEPGAKKAAPVVAAPALPPAVPLTPVQPVNP